MGRRKKMNERNFVVVVESNRMTDNVFHSVVTQENEKFLVVVDEEFSWDTGSRWVEGKNISDQAKLFPTYEAAEKFAKKWLGHPWWCKPNGNYEIFEVKPVYTQVLDRWDIVK